jgi:hypothetical protein
LRVEVAKNGWVFQLLCPPCGQIPCASRVASYKSQLEGQF